MGNQEHLSFGKNLLGRVSPRWSENLALLPLWIISARGRMGVPHLAHEQIFQNGFVKKLCKKMSRFSVCNLTQLLTQPGLVLTILQNFEEVYPQHSVIAQFSRTLRCSHHNLCFWKYFDIFLILLSKPAPIIIIIISSTYNFQDDGHISSCQGGRTWQAFGGGKNGHETFRQAHIYNFRDKCVVFARNLKFLNLTQ